MQFERYTDNAVVHCATREPGQSWSWPRSASAWSRSGCELHPAKTRIVYCKDGTRRGSRGHTSFTFLGFTFRARAARGKKRGEVHLVPARGQPGCPGAKMSAEVRRWRLHLRTWHTMGSLAREINPVVRGWMQSSAPRGAAVADGGERPSISLLS